MPGLRNPPFCDGQHSAFGAGAYCLYQQDQVTGETDMLGFELIGYAFLMLFFTAIQYACLLTSASKA